MFPFSGATHASAIVLMASLLVACQPQTPATVAEADSGIESAAVDAAAAPPALAPQDRFFAALSALCGQRFNGRMVSTDPVDVERFSGPMQMHVRDCSESEIRIPFSVGEDRSRTWVISRTETGLRLKHDHRHADGSEDELSQYGGDTDSGGSATRQEFPVDAYSKQLFEAHGLNVSMTNVWAMEVIPGELFAYELRRENRFFRVEFGLREPAPPAEEPAG